MKWFKIDTPRKTSFFFPRREFRRFRYEIVRCVQVVAIRERIATFNRCEFIFKVLSNTFQTISIRETSRASCRWMEKFECSIIKFEIEEKEDEAYRLLLSFSHYPSSIFHHSLFPSTRKVNRQNVCLFFVGDEKFYDMTVIIYWADYLFTCIYIMAKTYQLMSCELKSRLEFSVWLWGCL